MPQKINNLQGIRPFRLVKFFTFSSLVIMFTATIVISALNAHWVRNILLEKNQEFDLLLVENLNHQIITRFMGTVIMQYRDEIRLSDPKQHKLMDGLVRSTLHSFNVEMINIYDNNNKISYSYDLNKRGLENAGGVGYEKALKKETTSRLTQQGSFIELLFWFPQETKIVTFAPIIDVKRVMPHIPELANSVAGVVEIVRDVSEDYKKIFKLQGLIVASCFIVMGILFIVLRFVVKQGEKIIERRAEERLNLEEKLRQAEHISGR